ncbi:MAG: hypothetical protein IPJ65_31835 [Archangiaceae bacterium]|nr:hypothetical protein [Archangiaceae bacterium]
MTRLPLLKLALGTTALAVAAVLLRQLLRRPLRPRRAAVTVRPAAANDDVEVPWGTAV